MTINFDGLRSQLAYTYDKLAQALNNSIKQSRKYYGDDDIRISPEEIQEEMDDLRSRIMVLCCCYEEGEDGFKDISEKVKPIAYFNPVDENQMPEVIAKKKSVQCEGCGAAIAEGNTYCGECLCEEDGI